MKMYSQVLFAFLVADVNAHLISGGNPNTVSEYMTDERLVGNSIKTSVEAVSQSIQDAGLDPLYIDEIRYKKSLPVPVLFNAEAFVVDILSTGLSNIVVHRSSYSVITNRLNFDIEMPLIHFSVGASSLETTLFGSKLDVKASGKVEIHSIRVVGQVRVRIGIISGITIDRVIINFILGDITSHVRLVIQGKDFSCKVNKFIGSTLPNTIKDHNAEINKLLEIVLLDLINARL